VTGAAGAGGPGRRLAVAAALLALLALGAALRVHRWREAPPGPWIDEALALRAARLAAATHAPLFGMSPLQPPDAGFVNSWLTNVSLRGLSVVDRIAGGGIASVRAMSILPSLVLLLALVAIAREAAPRTPLVLLPAAALGATSSWLLVTGRWGWNAIATSALVALAAAAALRAARRGSAAWAAAAGGTLGLACYGYVAAWALAPLPALLLIDALRRRDGTGEGRRRVAAAASGLAVFGLVAAPLAAHLLAHPGHGLARARELSPARAASPGRALAENAAAYARLFVVGGDPNERHGDPSRPVLPLLVTGLALAGAAAGVRRAGAERLLAVAAGLLLLSSLLAVERAANAYRSVQAAPFLLVLAALGAARLVGLVPPARRLAATAVLALAVGVSAALDASAFLGWLSSPRLEGAFGGPERRLADAIAAERSARPAVVVLAPGAARNAFVVDALLQEPGRGAPAIRQARGLDALRFVPAGDLLFADAATQEREAAPRALGAARVATGGAISGFPGWTLWRLPRERASAAARAALDPIPLVPSPGRGGLVVAEEGLYTFATRGGVEAVLDGGLLFGSARPAGVLAARLAPGRHELRVVPRAEGASLRVTGPDGFVLPLP
jgi:hypothetical protein